LLSLPSAARSRCQRARELHRDGFPEEEKLMPPTLAEIETMMRPLLPGLLGITITEATSMRVSASMQVRPELCTYGGVLHGGAFMAFADTVGAVGTVINLPPGARTTTLESKTNFLGAAPVNTLITAQAIPLHRGRTTMVWQTMIRSDAGKLCAVVTQTQMVLQGEQRAG
jgi:1,4-dihydroxy-2-naphthoyl-CoA hydrolase